MNIFGAATCSLRLWWKKARPTAIFISPPGRGFDWWTGAKVEGGKWVDRPVDLATMPIYVRAGAIIPLDPVRQYTAQPVTGPTTLRVYPGADGDFTLYDDDGKSPGYRDGSDPEHDLDSHFIGITGASLTLEPDPRMKKWPGKAKEFAVELAGAGIKPQTVRFTGKITAAKL